MHDALQAIERLMSTYLADSELSRLNHAPAGTPFALSADTFAVLALAGEIARDTDGAFDVTVAPLVDAWGFGPSRDRRVVAEDERRALLARVGPDRLALDADRRAVVKARADVAADLSAIAKGYGVDHAARALDALGVANYMVEAGGEVRTRGRNADGSALADRDRGTGRDAAEALVRRAAVGPVARDLRRLPDLLRAGRTPLLPRDRPGQRGGRSTTASPPCRWSRPDCARADALATALMVMGETRGSRLRQRARHRRLLHRPRRPAPAGTGHAGLRRAGRAAHRLMDATALLPVFLAALAILGIAVAAMAIGVMMKRPCLRGSCGGAAVTGPGGQKLSCETCPNRKR